MSLEEPRDEGGGREQSPRRSSPRKLIVQPFTSNVKEDEKNIELQDFETSALAVLKEEDEPTKKTVRVSESYEDAIARPSKESKK